MATVKFYFDYISPYAYLASTQLPRLELDITWQPISVIEVMDKVGNQPTPRCPAKLRYAMEDTQRWAARYGVPLRVNQDWWAALEAGEFDMRALSRGALAAQTLGCFDDFHVCLSNAIWGGLNSDVVSRAGREQLLNEAGLDGAQVWDKAESDSIGNELEQRNEQAAQAGVFGVPIFVVGDEMFFGNDRLDFLVEAVRSQKG